MPRSREGVRRARPGPRSSGSARRPRAGRRRCPRSSAPVTVSPLASRSTVGAHRRQQSRAGRRRPGWWASASPGRRDRPPVTSAAARNGAALDRSGSMTRSTGATAPGATRQRSGVGVVDARHRPRAAWRRSSRCAAARAAGSPTWRTSMPSSKRGAGEQQRGDELRRRRCVEVDRAALDRAVAAHDERQRAPAAVVDVHAQRPQRLHERPHRALAGARVAVEGDVAVGQGGDRRDEPHDGAGQSAVDVAPPRAGRARSPSPSPASVTDMPSDLSAPAISSVSRGAQRAPQGRARPARAASTRARLVADFEPGTATTASTGSVATGAAHRSVIAPKRRGRRRCLPWIALDGLGSLPRRTSGNGRSSSTSRERRTSSCGTLGGAPALVAPRCPHRLVPLDAAQVADGVLTCRYHGWQFGLDGSCLRVPSMGDAEVPRGAHLAPAPQVVEDDGGGLGRGGRARRWPYAGPRKPDQHRPRPRARLACRPRGRRHRRRACRPPAGSRPRAPTQRERLDVRARGARHRRAVGPGARRPFGAARAALRRPGRRGRRVRRRVAAARRAPSSRPALVADNFLDVAHFPFVHAGTFGVGRARSCRPYDVDRRAGRLPQHAGAVVRQPRGPRRRGRDPAGAPASPGDVRLPRAVPAAAAARGARRRRGQDDPVPGPPEDDGSHGHLDQDAAARHRRGRRPGRRRGRARGRLRGGRARRGPRAAGGRWTSRRCRWTCTPSCTSAPTGWAWRCAARCAASSRGLPREHRPAAAQRRPVGSSGTGRHRRRRRADRRPPTATTADRDDRPRRPAGHAAAGRAAHPPRRRAHRRAAAATTSPARCSRASRSGPSGSRT